MKRCYEVILAKKILVSVRCKLDTFAALPYDLMPRDTLVLQHTTAIVARVSDNHLEYSLQCDFYDMVSKEV